MAKTINLTVKVDDTEFTQFINNFNAFAAQIGNLNKQFKQINTTMSKTTSNFAAMMDSAKSLINALGSVSGIVEKVGRGFMRWGTAIGGIVSMLTTGAGMFGIDRLAESIMLRRRQAMGLGTTRGGLLGVGIGGQTFLNDPTGVMTALRTAMGGGPNAGAAASLGVFPGSFGGDAARAFPTVVRNLQQVLQRAAPGTEVAVGQAYTQGQLGFTDQDYVRLRQMTKKELEQELARMEEIRKASEMTKEAQKGWAALSIQFTKAKTALESAFGERFAELTKPLQQLSDAFIDLVKALLNSKTVTDVIHWLTRQLEKLTKVLEKDPDAIGKKIKEWDEYIEKEWLPLLKFFREALEGFTKVFAQLKDELRLLLTGRWLEWYQKYGKGTGVVGGGGRAQSQEDIVKELERRRQEQQQSGGFWDRWNRLRDMFRSPGGGTSTQTPSQQQAPPAQQQQAPQQQQTPAPPPQTGTTTSPATNVPPWARDRGVQGMFMPGTNINQQFASAFGGRAVGGPAFGGTTMIGGVMNRGSVGIGGANTTLMARNWQGGGMMNVGGARNTSMGLAFGGIRGGDTTFGDRTGGDISLRGGRRSGMFASIRGGNRIAMFGGATRGRVPGTEMNAFRGITTVSQATAIDNRKGLAMLQGPLDTNNWQMNRTTSLSIRNVPGSNVFMQGAGMGVG